MFSQLFTNSCRSCFSVLPCLKIRRGHHTFLTDFLPVLSVTLSVKASFAKKWPYKWTAQRSFYQSILHMSRGNNQMLFHWDSVKENHSQKPHTADWILISRLDTGYRPCACACHAHWKFCHQSRRFLCVKNSRKRTPKSLGLWVWFSSRNCCVQTCLLQGINLPPDQQLLGLRGGSCLFIQGIGTHV